MAVIWSITRIPFYIMYGGATPGYRNAEGYNYGTTGAAVCDHRSEAILWAEGTETAGSFYQKSEK